MIHLKYLGIGFLLTIASGALYAQTSDTSPNCDGEKDVVSLQLKRLKLGKNFYAPFAEKVEIKFDGESFNSDKFNAELNDQLNHLNAIEANGHEPVDPEDSDTPEQKSDKKSRKERYDQVFSRLSDKDAARIKECNNIVEESKKTMFCDNYPGRRDRVQKLKGQEPFFAPELKLRGISFDHVYDMSPFRGKSPLVEAFLKNGKVVAVSTRADGKNDELRTIDASCKVKELLKYSIPSIGAAVNGGQEAVLHLNAEVCALHDTQNYEGDFFDSHLENEGLTRINAEQLCHNGGGSTLYNTDITEFGKTFSCKCDGNDNTTIINPLYQNCKSPERYVLPGYGNSLKNDESVVQKRVEKWKKESSINYGETRSLCRETFPPSRTLKLNLKNDVVITSSDLAGTNQVGPSTDSGYRPKAARAR